MSSWDKMDRKVWQESEVMQELEKRVAVAAQMLANEVIKKVAVDFEKVPEDLSKVNQEAGPAAKNLQEVADATERMYNADDGEEAEEAVEEIAEEGEEVVAELADLLEELQKLSYYIADLGDTSLAYKVERTIREIEAEPNED